MVDEPQTQAPVTDDQELAKVLASMSDEASKNGGTAAVDQAINALPPVPEPPVGGVPATPAPADVTTDVTPPPPPPPPAPGSGVAPAMDVSAPAAAGVTSDLEDIKKSALSELRPIVDKLDLPAEEKFEALLLVIRSSDDQSLIKAAYEAAEGIADEAKKAQALLDVVKEIEYFAHQPKV